MDKLDVIRHGYDTVRRGDIEAGRELLTPDARWHSAMGRILGKVVYTGFEEIAELVYREIPSVLEGFRPEVLEIRDLGGDMALAVVRWRATIRAGGMEVDQIFGQLCQVRDGKWKEMRSYGSVEAAEAAVPEVRARHGYEDWNRGELDAVVAAAHPDVVFEQDPGIVGAVTLHGRAALRDWLEQFVETWDTFQLDPEEFVVRPDGTLVAVLGLRATARGSGVSVESRVAHAIGFRDGLIHSWRSYTDPEAALA